MNTENNHISIAIDGPSGVGKSTVARKLADKLGFIYIDTGAMFRTMAVYFTDNNIDLSDRKKVSEAADNVDVEIKYIDGVQHMFANGTDVTDRLRTEQISAAASITSQYKDVRSKLLSIQRGLALKENVIMDGRDIGTVVLPDATLKIFLTASSEVRAKRRYDQLLENGKLNGLSYDDILKDQNERDYRDTHRSLAPLKAADDALTVDTSLMTIEEVMNTITGALNECKIS